MAAQGLSLQDVGSAYYEVAVTADAGPYGTGTNTIEYTQETSPNRFFTYNAGEVSVAGTHTVLIAGRTGGRGNGSNSRSRFDTWLELDAGGLGTWIEVGQTRTPHYLRQSNYGDGAFFLEPFKLFNGDKLRMRVQRRNGSGLFLIEPNYANFQIFARTEATS